MGPMSSGQGRAGGPFGLAARATAMVALRGMGLAMLAVLSAVCASSALAQAAAPNAPTDVGATAFSTSITVFWQAPAGGPEPTGYRATLLQGATQVGQPIETGATTFSATFRGLTPNTAYNVSAAALNGQTVGTAATAAARTSGPASVAPADVTTLYLTDDDTDALYAVDTETGAATRVGESPEFGANETAPGGLVETEDQLYMVGAVSDGIHRMDPTRGHAEESAIAPQGQFGASEDTPAGIAVLGETVYMVGDGNDKLYSVDLSTGIATAVGPVTGRGTSDFAVTGITVHAGAAYVVDDISDALYTLDLDRGVTTGRVGSSTQFGVSEVNPNGLASHNGALYMVGTTNDALYTLDTTTGAATQVGTSTAFGVSETVPAGLASHSGTLYMVGATNDNLYTLNTTTGAATRVGSSVKFGQNEPSPTGLASHSGTLYMVGAQGDRLYTLNTTTGVAATVGSSTDFGVSEGTPTGLASHNGKLYMVGRQNNALYTLSTSGAATRVSQIAVNFAGAEAAPSGLAAVGDTLYMVGASKDALYTLDTTTGSPAPLATVSGFGVGETAPGGIAGVDGVLYMVGQTKDALYILDLETGLARRPGYLPLGVDEATGLAHLSQTVVAGLRFFVNEGPAILDVSVTPYEDIDDHARIVFSWSETQGVRSAREGTAGYAVRVNGNEDEDAGLAQGWALVRGRAENTVSLEVRAYIDGASTGQMVEIDGEDIRIGIGERWYSPWSPLRVVSIFEPGKEVDTALADQQTPADAGITGAIGEILAVTGAGENDGGSASLWAQVLCMLLATGLALAVFYATGRGGPSVGLGAAAFLFVWSGLGLTLFGMHPALALLPVFLLLMGAVFIVVVKFKT